MLDPDFRSVCSRARDAESVAFAAGLVQGAYLVASYDSPDVGLGIALGPDGVPRSDPYTVGLIEGAYHYHRLATDDH